MTGTIPDCELSDEQLPASMVPASMDLIISPNVLESSWITKSLRE